MEGPAVFKRIVGFVLSTFFPFNSKWPFLQVSLCWPLTPWSNSDDTADQHSSVQCVFMCRVLCQACYVYSHKYKI